MAAGDTVQGPGGAFALDNGMAGKISGWSGQLNIGKADTTGFVDNGNVVEEPVDIQMVGSATGTTQQGATYSWYGSTGASPTLSTYKGNVTLTEYSGGTISFPAVIYGVSVDRPARGKASLTFNFSSRGALTTARS